MIQLSPTKLAHLGKRILTNLSKTILDKQQTDDNNDDGEHFSSSFLHGNFTMLPDEPHVDPEISADTRVKRELIKAMTRAILGLKESSAGLFLLTYKLIRKAIEKDQDFIEEMR